MSRQRPSRLSSFVVRLSSSRDWESALDIAHKFSEVKKRHGSEAFAVLASAKCTNEENFLFNKFTRQILGTNSIDHCARL
jgi:predicted molibdopterin-dependent oxidoreductase YjgC